MFKHFIGMTYPNNIYILCNIFNANKIIFITCW